MELVIGHRKVEEKREEGGKKRARKINRESLPGKKKKTVKSSALLLLPKSSESVSFTGPILQAEPQLQRSLGNVVPTCPTFPNQKTH